MLRELTLSEVENLRNNAGELGELSKVYALSMHNGEKVMVKEKKTAKGLSYVFYRYDNKLYRYQITGEIYACQL